MRLIIKIILWTIVVISVLIGGLYVYLRNADLNAYEEQIESLLTNAIGHEVDFDGLFELRFGRITTVTAENVTLRNPDWLTDPDIVSVERVFISFRPWSFIFGPAIIEELSVDGLGVRLERDESGAANWLLQEREAQRQAERDEGEFNPNAIVFKKLSVTSVELALRDAARDESLDAALRNLTITPDAAGILAIDLDGMINDFPLTVDGTIGTIENLIRGADVKADFDLTFGDLALSASGTFQDLQKLKGVYLESSLQGPDAEQITEALTLPPLAEEGGFDVTVSISPEDGGHHVTVEGNVGLTEFFVSGNIDDLLNPQVVSVEYRYAAPESANIASLFQIEDATRAAFNVSGGFRRDGSRYEFLDTDIELGRGRIGINGWIEGAGGVPDMDLSMTATGPDLAVFDPFVDLDGIPADPFDVSGRIQKDGDFWRFDDVDADIGEISIEVHGQVGDTGNPDNRIEFRATGPDVSALAEITGLDGLPRKPFDITADLRAARGGIRVESAAGIFGDNRVDASGVLNVDARLAGTDLQVRARGSELSNIAVLTGVPNLPTGAFDANGRVRVNNRRILLEDFTVSAGDLDATADGYLVRDSAPLQFAFNVGVNGSDLAASLPYEPLVRLPGESFDVRGHIEIQGSDYALSDFNVAVGNLRVYADGNIDTSRFLESDDIAVEMSAPDVTILRALSGLENLPDGTFELKGRLETTDRTIRVSGGSVSLGDYRFYVDGEVGRSRPYFGDDISITASGPSLYELGMIFDYPDMSSLPFELVTRFDGTETGFHTEAFEFRVGDSSLEGAMAADLSGDKPVLQANLSSTLLDLRHSQQVLTEEEEYSPDEDPGESPDGDKVFSDEPLELGWLDAAQVEIDLIADHIRLISGEVSDYQLSLKLQDGKLTIDPISFRQRRGSMHASLNLAPRDGAYDLDMSLDIDDVRPPLLAAEGQDPMTVPPVDIEFSLKGQGNSVSEIVGSSNGYVFVFQEQGQIAMLGLRFMFNDLVSGVVRTINPLARRQTYTNLDCSIVNVDIVDGLATIRNVAMQTDRLTLVSSGDINLATERLNLSVRSKPREGIGVSVGGVVNSFIRVAGTIGQPSIEIDPTSSVTTTGAAVATGGLSLLARGLWDRLSAEADMCGGLPRTRRDQ